MKGKAFDPSAPPVLSDPLAFVISGMTTQCAAIRKDAFVKAGGFNEDLRYLEDTDIFCRLAVLGQFYISSDVLAVIRRLPDDSGALTQIEARDPLSACRTQIQVLEGLSKCDLNPAQKQLVRRKLSGAYFRLARHLPDKDRADALRAAAKLHPSPLRGWIKSTIAHWTGDWGMETLLHNDKRLDRTS